MSDRDKKLLLMLFLAILVFGTFKLFDTFSTQVTEREEEYRELNDRYSDLVVKNGRERELITETEQAHLKYNELINGYNTSLSQEQTLIFLGMVEENTGVWLKQVGLGDVSTVYSFGKVTSTNPSRLGQLVYTTDYQGISTSMTLAYECSYDELKKVLTYLREQGKKATVTNISYAYSQATDTVTGTMTLMLYAITGSDRVVPEINISDVSVGSDNIFASDTFISITTDGSYKEQIINNRDLYLIMDRLGADMDTISMGMAGDPSNKTTVTSNTPGNEEITIEITGTAGDYKVKYKVGSEVYPKENYDDGAQLICEESLDFLIISKPRVDENDNSHATVNIINKTDKVLNITVINDDEEDPRIKIENPQGMVKIYE